MTTSLPPVAGLLDTAEAAAYIRLPARTLEYYRSRGVGPSFLRVGRRIFYRRAELDLWLDSCRVEPGER
jgi:DNA-binding transcriptional MerR regulator